MYRFESLLVRSSFPFGLFWASFRLPVDAEYYIYPQPKGKTDWPGLHPSGETGSPHSQKPGDDFSGVRAYCRGNRCGMSIGRPMRGAGPFRSSNSPAVPATNCGSMPRKWKVAAGGAPVATGALGRQRGKEEIPYALRLGRTTLPWAWAGAIPARPGGAGCGGSGFGLMNRHREEFLVHLSLLCG